MKFLNHIPLPEVREVPLTIMWPAANSPAEILCFKSLDDWRKFVLDLSLHPLIPEIVAAKFQRAQKLYYLGWIDGDLIKAGEIVAFAALELALVDRYGKLKFDQLLKHMVQKDGLTDAAIPMVRKSKGVAVGRLTGDAKPTLADIRNGLMHGEPFDGLPWAGLLELVRDLIHYAYRHYLVEAGVAGASAGL